MSGGSGTMLLGNWRMRTRLFATCLALLVLAVWPSSKGYSSPRESCFNPVLGVPFKFPRGAYVAASAGFVSFSHSGPPICGFNSISSSTQSWVDQGGRANFEGAFGSTGVLFYVYRNTKIHVRLGSDVALSCSGSTIQHDTSLPNRGTCLLTIKSGHDEGTYSFSVPPVVPSTMPTLTMVKIGDHTNGIYYDHKCVQAVSNPCKYDSDGPT